MSSPIQVVQDWFMARRLAKEIVAKMRQCPRGVGFDYSKGKDQHLVAQALTLVLAEFGNEWAVMDNRAHWTVVRRSDMRGFDATTARQLDEAQIIFPSDYEVHAVNPVRVVDGKEVLDD